MKRRGEGRAPNPRRESLSIRTSPAASGCRPAGGKCPLVPSPLERGWSRRKKSQKKEQEVERGVEESQARSQELVESNETFLKNFRIFARKICWSVKIAEGLAASTTLKSLGLSFVPG